MSQRHYIFLLSFFFLNLLFSQVQAKCPHCKMEIHDACSHCPYCKRSLGDSEGYEERYEERYNGEFISVFKGKCERDLVKLLPGFSYFVTRMENPTTDPYDLWYQPKEITPQLTTPPRGAEHFFYYPGMFAQALESMIQSYLTIPVRPVSDSWNPSKNPDNLPDIILSNSNSVMTTHCIELLYEQITAIINQAQDDINCYDRIHRIPPLDQTIEQLEYVLQVCIGVTNIDHRNIGATNIDNRDYVNFLSSGLRAHYFLARAYGLLADNINAMLHYLDYLKKGNVDIICKETIFNAEKMANKHLEINPGDRLAYDLKKACFNTRQKQHLRQLIRHWRFDLL